MTDEEAQAILSKRMFVGASASPNDLGRLVREAQEAAGSPEHVGPLEQARRLREALRLLEEPHEFRPVAALDYHLRLVPGDLLVERPQLRTFDHEHFPERVFIFLRWVNPPVDAPGRLLAPADCVVAYVQYGHVISYLHSSAQLQPWKG